MRSRIPHLDRGTRYTFINICFFSLGRLYSSSFLATLDTRSVIREAADLGSGRGGEDLSLEVTGKDDMDVGMSNGV
jgi:hypothetical protein